MGSENLKTSHCSRTYWTPAMERYFIDLMLEHLHRGNRVGHTSNKQAWVDMLVVFNAKFGSQYDKDVLKSRYTNLWKQFNDIKNLLSHGGFSWDETQQMVVADDVVWDAYIKVHPEVRPYKNKAVLNFSDLCLIYGYTVADGRYSRSSHDIDVEDEAQEMFFGDGIGSLAASSTEHSRTEWTTDMDQYFIELMLMQQKGGNKYENTFSKQAWTDMLALFNAKFGPQHSKRILRHRYRKLWKYYSDLTVLIRQDVFSWDEKQQMVVADDDVWDAYIKVHPHARSYRTKSLPNYKDLVLIFGDATGHGIQSNMLQNNKFEHKAKGTKTGSERSRTYWTPPMDRYLIGLLLDQVHKGNRVGQTFITHAWIDIVKSFNAIFKSQHDKDVLKNRFKHFRKQYNDVKVLLEQSGFSWDERREMVTAEDHVWDAYIKEHPDARSYRVKTVPSYCKLCVIYGQDNFDNIYSCLDHKMGPDVEASGLIDEGDNDKCHAREDGVIDWTPLMDRYLIDHLLASVDSKNEVDHKFDEPAWADMIASFNKRFGVNYLKHVLENQYQNLMKQYTEISSILNHDGFAWNETRQMITASNYVWEAYIKDHPNAHFYRDKVLVNYSDLCMVFGATALVDEKLIHEDFEMDFDQNFLDIRINEVTGGLQMLVPEIEITGEAKKQLTSTSASERPSKVQKTDEVYKQMAFTDSTGLVTKFLNKRCMNYSLIESAINILQAMPNIDDELLLDGCDLLEDEKKAKTFLALDGNLRKKWLLRKLGRASWLSSQY